MRTLFCRSDQNAFRRVIFRALISFAGAFALAQLLTIGKFELPQRQGQSLFALISDDTRMVVSRAMMEKADAYFHGGATAANCSLEKHAAETVACERARAHTREHEHEHEHEHAQSEHMKVPLKMVLKRPFLWINSEIHAREHRHLEDERSVELLPWVSAAVKASPHNIQAYESGSYILSRMLDKPELGVNFLKKGISNNPENVALELSTGEIYLNRLNNSESAAAHFEAALAKSLAKEGRSTEDDLFERLKIYFYLGYIAKENHDVERLKSISRGASETVPENVMAHTLAEWLREEREK